MTSELGRSARIAVGIAVCAAVQAKAQAIRGLIDAPGDLRPAGAIVSLYDAQGQLVRRALAGEDGRFSIMAPAIGRYRIRVTRLGFRPTGIDSVEVGGSGVSGLRLTMTRVPVQLDVVAVTGDRRCLVRPDSATAIFQVWDAAQAALSSTSLAGQDGRLNLTIVTFQRERDAATGRLISLHQDARAGNTTHPFAALLGAAELAERGYVDVDADGSVSYRGPDAEVLLSPAFLDAHCFRLVDDDSAHAGQVGLAFRPVRSRNGVADLEGILWVDRRRSELRSLAWSYTNIEPVARDAGAGGRAAFMQLPTGLWVVNDWVLRMPVVTNRVSSSSAAGGGAVAGMRVRREVERVVHKVVEVGGAIVSVRDGTNEVLAERSSTMRLVDAGSGAAVRGATAELAGTSHRATSDSLGVVRFARLLPGEYDLAIIPPALAKLGVGFITRITVDAAGVAPVEVAIPPALTVLRSACRDPDATMELGVIGGTLTTPDGLAPPHAVRVRATMVAAPTSVQSRGGPVPQRESWARTDEAGRFYLCGLPWDTEAIVVAPGEPGQPGARAVPRRDAPARVDIVLNQ